MKSGPASSDGRACVLDIFCLNGTAFELRLRQDFFARNINLISNISWILDSESLKYEAQSTKPNEAENQGVFTSPSERNQLWFRRNWPCKQVYNTGPNRSFLVFILVNTVQNWSCFLYKTRPKPVHYGFSQGQNKNMHCPKIKF